MKRLICIFICLACVFTACSNDEPIQTPEPPQTTEPPQATTTATTKKPETTAEPQAPEIDLEAVKEYLRQNFDNVTIDGSTSMIHLHNALRNEFTGNMLSSHSKTVHAFEHFIAGINHILFSVDYSDDMYKQAKEAGVYLVQLPITREAFVFLINKNNPVQNLTQQQIKDIYSGKITNWKELGGNDAPIHAFQRNEDSGSQMRMVKFMGDTPLIEASPEYVEGGMGGIIERVSSYDEGVNSIAYNMYTFTEKQYPSEDVIMLAVDGVYPTDETIFDETYPLVIYNYIFYNKNVSLAAEYAENLYTFLMSDEGQELISEAGYINLNTALDRNLDSYISTLDYFDGEHIETYIPFHDKITGKFNKLDGRGGLIISDNFADYYDPNANEKTREVLIMIGNAGVVRNELSTSGPVREKDFNGFFINPYMGLMASLGDALNYKYNDKYYAYFAYDIDEDVFILIPESNGYFDYIIDNGGEGFIAYVAKERIIISHNDLKNLYFKEINSWDFDDLKYYLPFGE